MNFSSLSIKHPVPAIMLFALLSLAGILSFRASVVQDFPDIELPIVTVSAALSGAAPAQLETEVARKIEDSVATLQGVKNIYTKVLDGEVTVTVEFILEKPIAEAVNDVRDAVARVRADLPADVRDPSVTKASTSGRVVLTFTAAAAPPTSGTSTPLDDQALSWFVDNTVAKRLLSVPGVGAVKRMGGVNREVRVELNADKMAALNVAAIDVSRRLKLVQQEAPGGRGDVSGAEQSVRTIATVKTAAELARLDIPLADGRHIRLDQVATVLDTVAEPRSVATQDGRPVVGFEVFRTKGAGEVDVARGVRAAVAQLQAAHPTVTLKQVIDNAQPVDENFQGSMELLYEGALLAILVVWWFLRDWRATLVAAAALPLSVIPTFLGLHVLRLHAQHRDAAVAGAGGRRAGGRRDRRDREHRAPPAHGQVALPGGDGSRRRDRHGGDRHHLRPGGGVFADRLHGRRAGAVLQAVRLDRRAGHPGLAAGGAAAHPDDGGLHPEASQERGARRPQGGLPRGARRLAHGALHGHHALVPAPPRHHHDRGRPVLRRLDRAGALAAHRFRARGGPGPDPDQP